MRLNVWSWPWTDTDTKCTHLYFKNPHRSHPNINSASNLCSIVVKPVVCLTKLPSTDWLPQSFHVERSHHIWQNMKGNGETTVVCLPFLFQMYCGRCIVCLLLFRLYSCYGNTHAYIAYVHVYFHSERYTYGSFRTVRLTLTPIQTSVWQRCGFIVPPTVIRRNIMEALATDNNNVVRSSGNILKILYKFWRCVFLTMLYSFPRKKNCYQTVVSAKFPISNSTIG